MNINLKNPQIFRPQQEGLLQIYIHALQSKASDYSDDDKDAIEVELLKLSFA